MLTTVKAPAYYRHFKGKFSLVLGISQPLCLDEVTRIHKESCIDAVYSENQDDTIPIYMDNLCNRFHNDLWCKEELVIYMTMNNESKICARPISSFLEEVGDAKGNVTGQKYRFEEYKL